MLLQQIINGIVIGSVYALTAMGATLVYGILRILDIANAGAYAIGAYSGLFLYQTTGNLALSFLGATLLTGFFGTVVQKFLYLPLLEKPPLIPLIASIGLFIFIQDLLRLIAGPQIREFNARIPFESIRTADLTINSVWILIILLTTLLLLFLWYVLNKTKIGLAWRATAQDLEISTSMGVNVKKVVAFNFLLGYGFAAAAGVMIGLLYNSVFPTMGDVPAYKMLAIIVLGGLGNPLGTVVAGLLIGLVETLVAGYIGFFLPRDAIAFVALIAILLIKPRGLMSKKA
ncbi:MAG: branched-chain amino acid ABC transporter permease [Firmicutes bacterium]|jgi:branched-chain amino acid transport system permease protein|nr:branched-chain amino acid ABC transporter permease [Bacillota bacterium]